MQRRGWTEGRMYRQSKDRQEEGNISTRVWDPERRYRRSYLRSRNRGADVENRCMDTEGAERRDERGDWNGHVHARAQSCLTLRPEDCSPPGSSVHGISQARVLAGGCHFLLQGIFQTQESNPGLLRRLTGRRIL